MKINHVHHMIRKGFSLVELLVVIAIIAALAGASYGPIMNKIKEAAKSNAITNGKNIFASLQTFASDNEGLYPSEDTARSNQSGDTVEACFNQLMKGGGIPEEKLFWNKENAAQGIGGSKPDNDGNLDSGECSFGYVAGLTNTSRSNLPIVFDSSSQQGTFNAAVWDGKALVVKLDASASFMPIDYSGDSPTDDNGEGATGPVQIKRGGSWVDIFSESFLPDSAEVLVPSGN